MKNLVIGMKNRLMAESVELAFLRQPDYCVERVDMIDPRRLQAACEAVLADVLLMDVSRCSGNTLEAKLATAGQIKKKLPNLKIALICDATSDDTIADRVVAARRAGWIEDFYFESVTSDYLVASIDSL